MQLSHYSLASWAHSQFGRIAGLIGFLLLGALIWTKSSDQFIRKQFELRTLKSKNSGMAVLPSRFQNSNLPVVIYLHGRGGDWLSSGRALRQFAEVGFAAIDFNYTQSPMPNIQSSTCFSEEFSALLDWIAKKNWADTNRIVWVGFSLGARYLLDYAISHPERQPKLLARISGGMVDGLEAAKTQGQRVKVTCPVLLVHGDKDKMFPVSEMEEVAAVLRTNNVRVKTKILSNEGHSFRQTWTVMIRSVAEYCKAKLTPEHPFPEFPQIRPLRFWVCVLPALAWIVGIGWGKR